MIDASRARDYRDTVLGRADTASWIIIYYIDFFTRISVYYTALVFA